MRLKHMAATWAVALVINLVLFSVIPAARYVTGTKLFKKAGASVRRSDLVFMKVEKKRPARRKVIKKVKSRKRDRYRKSFQNRFKLDLSAGGPGMDGAPVIGEGGRVLEYDLGEVDKPPQVIRSSLRRPEYPEKARQTGVEGFAEVEFTVTEKGTVMRVQVTLEDPPHFGFGPAAARAVRQYRFKPALMKGIPVRVRMGQRIVFNF